MNILHVVTHVGGGGDWTVVRTLCKGQIGRGHTVYVNAHGDPRFPPEAHEVELCLNGRARAFLTSAWRVAKSLGGTLDAIHAHSPKTLLWGKLVALFSRRRVKVVMSYHWPVSEDGMRRLLKCWNFRLAEKIHCVSQDMVDDLASRYRVPKHKLLHVVLGVDESIFFPCDPAEKRRLRRERALPETGMVWGYIGRLDREKNVDWIVRYLVRDPSVYLIIAGDGPCKNSLIELAVAEGVAGRVRFLGRINDPARFFNLIDLNLLPSDYEAFGLTVVEAAFCGTPTIRSDVGGAHEQLVHGSTGFLFEIGAGMNGLHLVLDKVMRGEYGELAAMGAAAQRELMERCSLRRFIEKVDGLYG